MLGVGVSEERAVIEIGILKRGVDSSLLLLVGAGQHGAMLSEGSKHDCEFATGCEKKGQVDRFEDRCAMRMLAAGVQNDRCECMGRGGDLRFEMQEEESLGGRAGRDRPFCIQLDGAQLSPNSWRLRTNL